MGRKRQREDEFVTWVPPIPASPVAGSSTNPISVDTPRKAPAVKRPRKKNLDAPPQPTFGDTPTTAPAAKKPRKKKDADAPPEEKRGAIFKKSCPKNILERVDRVTSQRFFMVNRQRNGQELKEQFSVLGSTGNVYTVVIDKKPSCTCPDASKGNHCKHILFIFMKVLQVSYESHYWYQKALLTSELATVFAQAPLAPNSVAHPRVREAFARATGKSSGSSADQGGKNKRLPGPEDDCPVCYESMHKADVKTLTFCEECGNGLHLECFQQWARKSAQNLTCVFCRAKWVVPGPSGARAQRSQEGYINLANVAGLSPERDTSTYYHGPRRGQHYYGFQEYEDLY